MKEIKEIFIIFKHRVSPFCYFFYFCGTKNYSFC